MVIEDNQRRVRAHPVCSSSVASLFASLHALLLLVLLEHALVDLIALENFRLAPLLQLALHLFAEVHIQHLIQRCRIRSMLQAQTGLVFIFLRVLRDIVLVLDRAQVAASIVDNRVHFALCMSIAPAFDWLD